MGQSSMSIVFGALALAACSDPDFVALDASSAGTADDASGDAGGRKAPPDVADGGDDLAEDYVAGSRLEPKFLWAHGGARLFAGWIDHGLDDVLCTFAKVRDTAPGG